MAKFVLLIVFLCGTDKAVDENDPKIHACHEYYVNCAVGPAGEKDLNLLKECAQKRGDDYNAAEVQANKELN